MWFARLFGGREERQEYEEPTAAPPLQRPEKASVAPPERGPGHSGETGAQVPKPKGGFDPYNSGTFKTRNAWERVNRR